MESQPQNLELRNNPENFQPANFFSHIWPVSYPNILFLGWLLRSNLPVLIEYPYLNCKYIVTETGCCPPYLIRSREINAFYEGMWPYWGSNSHSHFISQ